MNHLKVVKFQYVTMGIIALNAIIYFTLESNLVFHAPAQLLNTLSLKPSEVVPLDSFSRHVPGQFRLLTYMFLHGSAVHLLFNMIFLFVFGDNVEDAMGHVRFIFFYLACGVLAALAHSVMTESPNLPLIGASGAVSGVIGAYLMLHPNIRVWILLPLPNLPFLPMRVPAGFVIGAWILYQLGNAMFFPKEAIAWWAHIGGFLAGAVLVTVMKRPAVPLFDPATGV